MNKQQAEFIVSSLREAGFNFVCSLPATQIHTVQYALQEDKSFTYVPVANEGEGTAICAGAWMGGKMPLMLMETSGILVATYALLRLHATFGVPTMLLSTYRGDLGEQEWYAVHTGAALHGLLEAMRIPSRVIMEPSELKQTFVEARRSMEASLHPVSIVMGGRVTRG